MNYRVNSHTIKRLLLGTMMGFVIILGLLLLFSNYSLEAIEIMEQPSTDLNPILSESNLGNSITSKKTPSTDLECKNGKCNVVIYSGIRNVYEDEKWKRIEDARSLKKAEGINLIYVEKDEKYGITIEDYNYTSFKNICLETTEKTTVPLQIYWINETIEKTEEKITEFSKATLDSDLNKCYNITVDKSTLNYFIKYGAESTIIQLNESNGGLLKDAYVDSDTNNTNNGNSVITGIRANSSTVVLRTYFNFNISAIPADVNFVNASLLVLDTSDDLTGTISVHQVYNGWRNGTASSGNGVVEILGEDKITWNNQPCGLSFSNDTNCNLTYESSLLFGNEGANWHSFKVNDTVWSAYSQGTNNVSFALKNQSHTGGIGTGFRQLLASKEAANVAQRPYLNITYVTGVDECAYGGTGNWLIDCSNNCNILNQVNVSGNLSLSGAGRFDVRNTINFNSTGQIISLTDECNMTIHPGTASSLTSYEILSEDFESGWDQVADQSCGSADNCAAIGDFNGCDDDSGNYDFCSTSNSDAVHSGSYALLVEDWDDGLETSTEGIWYEFDASTSCNGGQCDFIRVELWAAEDGAETGDNCWITERDASDVPANIIAMDSNLALDPHTQFFANLTTPMSSTDTEVRIMCGMDSISDEFFLDDINVSGFILPSESKGGQII